MSTASDALGLLQDPEGSLQPSVPINANADAVGALLAGAATRTLTADANYTLVAADYRVATLVLTSSVLTAGRDIVFPAYFPPMLVVNDTGQTLTLKKSGQTGVTVDNGKSIRINCGPTDVLASTVGGGGVTSVNGATGAVVLDDGDVKSVVTALTSGTTVTVDCSLGKSFTLTLGHNVGTLTLTNLAGAGFATEIEIEIKQNGTGGFTFALPASFKALGGSDTAIAAAANAVTVLSAKTFDNGTTWRYAMQESA